MYLKQFQTLYNQEITGKDANENLKLRRKISEVAKKMVNFLEKQNLPKVSLEERRKIALNNDLDDVVLSKLPENFIDKDKQDYHIHTNDYNLSMTIDYKDSLNYAIYFHDVKGCDIQFISSEQVANSKNNDVLYSFNGDSIELSDYIYSSTDSESVKSNYPFYPFKTIKDENQSLFRFYKQVKKHIREFLKDKMPQNMIDDILTMKDFSGSQMKRVK